MNRLISGVGTVLVTTGVAILVYIGVTYARALPPTSHSKGWTQAQAVAAHQLRSKLRGHQKVAVPGRLRHAAPVAGAAAVRIVIPRINVDSRVVQTAPAGGVWNVADWAVGHLTTTPQPGVPGNGAYAAHDDIKGELFKRLDELGPGDAVLLYTPHAVYRYVVVGQQTVDPSDVSVLNPTSQPTVTLISCAPYWIDTQRLVVQAVLKSSSPV